MGKWEMPGIVRDKSPCAYCQDDEKDRACHDSCKRFQEWKAKVEAVKEAKRTYDRLNRRKPWQRTGT